MKVMVTGVGGQLGYDVAERLGINGDEVLAPRHDELDITDKDSVRSYFTVNGPEALIHCAAYTAVDLAEDNEAECRKVNVEGTTFLVEQCRLLDIPIVYISTDYVFNGTGDQPWKVDDPTSPINVYGLSKRDGEDVVRTYEKHFIVRISWVFGINGKNFIKTMLDFSKKIDTVRVVADQYGSPTYTYDLAPLLCEMIRTHKYGTYHAHNEGVCTWYDIAVETFRVARIQMNVIPITSDEYPMRAKRPHNSRLETVSLKNFGFNSLPNWKKSIAHYIGVIKL